MPDAAKLLFGGSAGVCALLRDAELYARTSYPILILGEPGVGKTAIAKWIHVRSGRRAEGFVKQAASWIPEHLEVAHLAGHAKGAFTGAHEARPGLIESAHQGTFFLDELGLASVTVQQLLLQLLEDRTIRRMGEVRDRPVDVRFLAATNADLGDLVAQACFRADLLHRFGHLVLRVPRLADRQDEILPLAAVFLEREADALDLAASPRLSDTVRDWLMAAPWPGNIRELEAVCRYAVLHAPAGGVIELCDLPGDFVVGQGALDRARYDRAQLERARDAIRRAGGNKAEAARLLGCSRQQLYRMLGSIASAIILLAAAGRPLVSSHLSHRTHRPAIARQTTRLRQVG